MQDMSSEYTGLIGVGTASDGGAQFEEPWLQAIASIACARWCIKGGSAETSDRIEVECIDVKAWALDHMPVVPFQ